MAFQDFDLISQRRQQEKKKQTKRRLILAAVAFVVVVLAVAAGVCIVIYKNNQNTSTEKSHKASAEVNTGEKAVKAVCATTDYKKTCEESLMKAVKNNASSGPVDILRASFSAAMDEIDQVMIKASDLTFDTPMKKKAFDDCLVLLGDAKEELNSSVSSVRGKDLGKLATVKPELNNWLSAVLSYQQTCVDGFPDGEEKNKMKAMLVTLREMGGNALAIVSQMASIMSAFKASSTSTSTPTPASTPGSQRKLMGLDQDMQYPSWMQHEEHHRILKADASKFTPNATVAKDGTGNFTTVSAALNAMPEKYTGRYVIYVKEGVYDENVVVTKKMVNVTMYGDGSQKSIITGSKNFVDGVPTFQTATFAALGEGFMAQSLGFRNTAGPEKHQAVALRVQSDRSIFLNCRMEGFQDTLYAQTHRQFYRSCYITGTVDFIFGDAAAVFQNCMIYVRKPLENQQNIVTAQGRLDKRETTGIVLQNCRILADDKLEPEKAKFRSYLGRPWKEYSRTIIMETEIGDLIHPEGWMEWSGDFALNTLFYAEFNNKGPGANKTGRVKWVGYKSSIKKEDVTKFTVGPFLQGDTWLKSVHDVPVRFGMFT